MTAAIGPPLNIPFIDGVFDYSMFSDVQAKRVWRRSDTLQGLQSRIRCPLAVSKLGDPKKKLPGLPLIKLAVFGDQRSPNGSLRHDANLLAVTGCEIEHDAETMPFDAACDRMLTAGICALGYTSPSHTPLAPRWRFLVLFSGPLPPEQRRVMVCRLNGLLGGVLADESFRLSQAFFVGRVHATAQHYRSAIIPGGFIDLRPDLDADALGAQPAVGTGTGAGAVPDEVIADAGLMQVILTGGAGLHDALVRLSSREIGRGLSPRSVETLLASLMEVTPEPQRDQRWRERRGEIPRIVASAAEKFQAGGTTVFRECAKLLMTMWRERRSAESIQDAAHALLAAHGLTGEAAGQLIDQVADWCCRRIVADGARV